MADPTQYLCTERTIQLIEKEKFSLYSLRLVHALLWYVEKEMNEFKVKMAMDQCPPIYVENATLMALVGTPAANDLSSLRAGIVEMPSGVFDVLEEDRAKRSVKVKFKAKPWADSFNRYKQEAFALIDLDVVRHLRTVQQITFYMRVALKSGSLYPTFHLPWSPDKNGPWESVRRTWIAVASRLSQSLGLDILLIPIVSPFTGEFDVVKVKIVDAKSRWQPGKLYPKSGRGVVVASQGRAASLTKREVEARYSWRSATCP